MTAEIIPFIPPPDELIIQLGIATDKLKNTAMSRVCDAQVIDQFGNKICGHYALMQIASQIWIMAQAAQAYEIGRSKKNFGKIDGGGLLE